MKDKTPPKKIRKIKFFDVEYAVLAVPLKYYVLLSLEKSDCKEFYSIHTDDVEKWYGRTLRGHKLAVQFYGECMTSICERFFVAGTPEWRYEALHPEWGEPSQKHYAIPLLESFFDINTARFLKEHQK